jgi:hypothetical protein
VTDSISPAAVIRSNVIFNVLEKAVMQNRLMQKVMATKLMQRHLKAKVLRIKPGNVYFFRGYQSLHANEPCLPSSLRATALYHFGDPRETTRHRPRQRRPSNTMQSLSAAEKCRRVARRMSFTTFSADSFTGPDFCLIGADAGHSTDPIG